MRIRREQSEIVILGLRMKDIHEFLDHVGQPQCTVIVRKFCVLAPYQMKYSKNENENENEYKTKNKNEIKWIFLHLRGLE